MPFGWPGHKFQEAPQRGGRIRMATEESNVAVEPAPGNIQTSRAGFLLDLISGAETDFDSVQCLARSAARAFSRSADIHCAATLSCPGNPPATAGSTDSAACLAASDGRYGDGPMAQAGTTSGPVCVTAGSSQRWEAYRRRLVASGYDAALAVPLELEERTSCTLVLLAPAGFDFTPELVGEASWFAAVASQSLKLALEVRSVRSAGDNLQSVLESRTSIDVACGVIMAQNQCSYTEAFRKLAAVSRQRNLKVRSVADNILKAMPNGSPAPRWLSLPKPGG